MKNNTLKRLEYLEARQKTKPIFLTFDDVDGTRRKVSVYELIRIIQRQRQFMERAVNNLEHDPNNKDFVFNIQTAFALRHRLLDLIEANITNRDHCYVFGTAYQMLKFLTLGFEFSRHVCGTVHIYRLSGERLTFKMEVA